MWRKDFRRGEEGKRGKGEKDFSPLLPLLFFFLFPLLSSTSAQRLVLTARGSTAFIPTVKEYSDALLCTGCNALAPSRSNDKIELRLENKSSQSTTLQVSRDAYLPNADLQLEARYTFVNEGGSVIVAQDWLPLSQLPTTLYSGKDPNLTTSVEYRLVITGRERAGNYDTSVTYSLTSGGNQSSVNHKIRFAIPEVAFVRLRGQLASTGTVAFDYGGVNAVQYVRAVQTKTPLPPTASDFQQVEVFCNASKGYTITVQLFDVSSVGSSNTLSRVYLFGKVAQNQRLQRMSATDTLQLLARPEDFSLLVDGSEDTGSFRFVVQYGIAVNR
jgi:hypothetical protein